MARLANLRASLEPHFAVDTALPNSRGKLPSRGHCAVTAVIARELFGGDFVSTRIDGESHWFNRLSWNGDEIEFDITGDQYDLDPVRLAPVGLLHGESRRRAPEDVNLDTLLRAQLLAKRSGLEVVAEKLANAIHAMKRRSERGRGADTTG